jgi:hypothetical protein
VARKAKLDEFLEERSAYAGVVRAREAERLRHPALSEAVAWRTVLDAADALARHVGGQAAPLVRDQLSVIRSVAANMLEQLARGVHANPMRPGKTVGASIPAWRAGRANPSLAIVGANPGRRSYGENVLSDDVLALIYRHVEDGPELARVHLFGRGGRWSESRNGDIVLKQLPAHTEVRMVGQGGEVQLRHLGGLPLVGEF